MYLLVSESTSSFPSLPLTSLTLPRPSQCYIDRANIGNARLAGFEADLNLVRDVGPYGYNLLLTAFCEPIQSPATVSLEGKLADTALRLQTSPVRLESMPDVALH